MLSPAGTCRVYADDQTVCTVTVDDEPWFVHADICVVLDIANPHIVRRASTRTRRVSARWTPAAASSR
ncbi:hypothetical protein SRABI03_00451 [Microbacterium foliorum]|nr:hypothetical protein SRABI03_00451 [Microbacterium foliorum]